MSVQIDITYTVDLLKPMGLHTMPTLLFTEEEMAHRFLISVTRGAEEVSLSGAEIKGYFIRGDNATHELTGSVDEQGRAVVVLDEECYAASGRVQLAILASVDGAKSVIFAAEGGMHGVKSDSILDPDNIVPSLSDLLAQIDAMEEAIDRANEAADRANDAADNAGSGGSTGGGLPEVTETDEGMPLRVENGEYKVGKLQKNAVEGLVTDFINIYGLFDAKDAAIAEKADKVHTHAFSEITDKPSTFLTAADRQSIINDALTALAGADPNNATAAVVENLTGRTSTLEVKARNIAEDLATLQAESDEFQAAMVEMMVKVVCRIVQLERHLGLQPPQNDDLDTTTEIDEVYDNVFGQG